MKSFLLFLVLLVISRIETNEATRTLDDTHLLLPSLQTRSPVKTPSPNPGTETSVSMASKVTERNFAGRKEVFVPPPPSTNAYPLDDETHVLLPTLKTRPPVKTPSPNSGTEVSVSMASNMVTERNFVGRKKVVFAPPPPPPLDSTNAYHLHKTHLLLPSLQTRPPINTPTPNPGTEASVSMASTVTERNFVGRKEVVFSPPPSPSTNSYPLEETHLLLPSLQTHSTVKTPSPNPGTETSVSMASKVTERNFAGRKEVFVPPTPSTNTYPLDDETHVLLPTLKTRPPVKTPSPNPGTEASVSMASNMVTERNFVGRKEVVFAPPPPPLDSTNAYHLHETHLLLPSLQTRPPINTPTPNPGTEASVSMASTVTERNFVGHKKVIFSPPPPPSTNPYPLEETHLLLSSLQTRRPVKTPSPNPGTEASVSMASRVTERNFVGRKEVVFSPPSTNIYPIDETHLLLPSLQTRPPVKTPTPNPGTEASVSMKSRVIERNFAGCKEVVFAPPVPTTNAYPHNNALFI